MKLPIPFSQVLKGCSLKKALIIPFTCQMVGIVGLVGYLSVQAGHQSVESLVQRLVDQVGDRVHRDVDNFTANAVLTHQLALNALDRQQLDLDLSRDSPQRDQLLVQWAKLSDLIAWISLGAATTGDYAGVYRSDRGELQLAVANASTDRQVWYYALEDQGVSRGRRVKIKEDFYDARSRPWYQSVDPSTSAVVWSEPYVGYTAGTSFVSASLPLYQMQNQERLFWGVISVDINLEQLDHYLQNLLADVQGQVIIINSAGNVITGCRNCFSDDLRTTTSPMIRALADSTDPVLQAVGASLGEQQLLSQPVPTPVTWKDHINRKHYWINAQPYTPSSAFAGTSLRWWVITVIPESSFMLEINRNIKTTIVLCTLALAISIVGSIVMGRWIVKPLVQLSRAAHNLAQGQWDGIIAIDRWDEVGQLTQAFNHMAQDIQNSLHTIEVRVQKRTQELATAKAVLEKTNDQLQTLAVLDPLTNIANRRCFDQVLESQWNDHLHQQHSLSLILLDIDYFKQYNDYYGHIEGDQTLKAVANALSHTFQHHQFSTLGLVARYGG
ncbi:diguanylate cyclase domain-containing protein, partial [Prochlorothrix hollandica]|uniref:diguanylate cyclase domain-containing protein n=1 Tax=Prochlorothrix hollandica TaxID=1223 RepID=UPI0033406121